MTEPMPMRLKAKYRVGRIWGHKSKHNQQGTKGRRKTGAKQVHDHRVPVLLDGRRVTWMRYSEWRALHGE